MCRVLLYMGEPILLDQVLHHADNALVKQSYNPKLMTHIQNLAGFGMAFWQPQIQHRLPILYKSAQLPFYDRNLSSLASAIEATSLLAHVRGVTYHEDEVVNRQNAHPFLFNGANIVLAHNGSLADIDKMKHDLCNLIAPHYLDQIAGTTDSELMYALLLTQLESFDDKDNLNNVAMAVLETLEIILKLRRKYDIDIASPVNLFINGKTYMIATRYVYDYGHFPIEYGQEHFVYHSLWYTLGDKYTEQGGLYKMQGSQNNSSIIIASEPLTEDTTTWIEIPEYSLILVEKRDKTVNLKIQDIPF